jgi:transcriptional regulator with XRE-family HTH domain
MPSADKEAIGEWLKAIRVNAGLTQKQLAAAVGTDGPHVIAWEKGRSIPGGRNLLAILHACGAQIVASTEPPAVMRVPESRAELVRAIEALSAQMMTLTDAALRLTATHDGAPDSEEASA